MLWTVIDVKAQRGDRLRFYNGSGEIAKVLVYPGSSADGVYEEYFYWGEQMFYTYVWDGDEKQYFLLSERPF